LTLDRDRGPIVTKVAPGSPADKAGLKPGDELGAAGGRRIFTEADFRGVLHREGKGDTAVELVWLRNGEQKTGTLQLTGDWRRTDLGWRKSVAEADIGANTGFPWPLACSDKERSDRGVAKGSMCVKPYFPKGAEGVAGDAGLNPGDFIIAVNGEKTDVSGRAFLVWFRQKLEPGELVTLTVVDGRKKQRTVKYKAPGRSR
jgi:S1-C subfamily serine protease